MSNGAGKPKPAFFAAITVIVLGLIGFAVYRMTAKKQDDTGGGSGSQFVDPRKPAGSAAKPSTAENPDPNAPPLTETKYEFEPAQRLPEVKDTGDYKPLGKDRVVRFAVNTWAGWAPIVWANRGHEPKKKWKDGKGGEFQVELQLIDDIVKMRNAIAAGNLHIGWATVDMLPLLISSGLKKEQRTMPRVYQQIDWSNGGDGIVARKEIATVGALRGKTIVLAQNSPSHYFLMNMLLNAGVGLKDVKLQYAQSPFQAATAFRNEKGLAAAVSWAPDIYTLTKDPANKMLVSTVEANKLIADVWFARADFGQGNPDIIEGLVRGIFDGIEELQTDQNKDAVAPLMGKLYNISAEDAKKMLGDAHWTNYAENRDFFLVSSNPTNFERTYNTAHTLYSELYKDTQALDSRVEFDRIVDFSIIKKLGGEPKYASQQSNYDFKFTPASAESLNVEKNEILQKTVVIKFPPNSHDLFGKVTGPSGGVVLYDGNVEFTVEQIAKLAGTFGAARIVIEGHTDSSMKNAGGDEALVKALSQRRANAVKEALVNKYKMNPNQFSVIGFGWDKPADPNEPNNHAKNRRVEVKVVPAEAQ
jgi:NitT/TauT family transport system substrate-binding protein